MTDGRYRAGLMRLQRRGQLSQVSQVSQDTLDPSSAPYLSLTVGAFNFSLPYLIFSS